MDYHCDDKCINLNINLYKVQLIGIEIGHVIVLPLQNIVENWQKYLQMW